VRLLVCSVRVLFIYFREKGDFCKNSTFLNVRQRKNLRWVHSAWELVDDQSVIAKDLTSPQGAAGLVDETI
jgi:hypothetical protein